MEKVVAVTNLMKEMKMKTVNKIVIGVIASLGIGLTVASIAQPGPMHSMGRMHSHAQMMDQNSNMKIMRDLMTPAERLTMMDRMIDANTLEERQVIMTTHHTEIEKRAKEKGITLPAGHGPEMMFGRSCR
jgi:nitrate reductase beta subunit